MAASTTPGNAKWKLTRGWWALATGAGLPAALLVAALMLTAACGGGDDGGVRALISEGAVAPDFTLPAANGEPVALSDHAGEANVLLYFSMGSG